MSKLLSLSLLLLFANSIAIAQSPQQFAYQAVVRDNNNQLVSNRTLGMRVSILKDSTNGQSAYTETHTPKTNQQGIVQLNIGGGTVVSGSFSSVPWSNGKLFVKTEMDLQGGTNYTVSGTTQLLSVPYAMYSSNVPVSKSGDTVTIGTSKLIIPGSQLLPGSGTAPASLSNGLVAYYPFNGNANDESGNGNHGIINGGVSITTDRFNKPNSAFYFNGVNGYISVPKLDSLKYIPITYSLWVIVSSYIETLSVGNKFKAIIGRNTAYVRECGVIGFFLDTKANSGTLDNQFAMWRGGGALPPPFSKSIPEFNKWVHIAYTQTITGDWTWYLNGIKTNYGNFTDIQNQFSYFQIGSCNNFTALIPPFWDNKLDDIRIYNRALTQEEITYLANN